MRRLKSCRCWVLAALLAAAPGLPAADTDSANSVPVAVPPLTADQVLESAAQHFPEILQLLAAQRGAAGKVLEAEGAFDLVFSADGFSRVGGFYDGSTVKGLAKQRLRPLGTQLYGGYKLSNGDFPIYEDINFTNTGGTAQVGALFSLLRDRTIDQQRFQEFDAQLGLQRANLDVLLTRIGVQQQALIAYWQWVGLGRQVQIYENLLRIAIERQTNLEEQVRSGARARIFLTENQQNIVRRQTLVRSARRDLRIAANTLSFYYRDQEGDTIIPTDERLPPTLPIGDVSEIALVPEAATTAAVYRRPELAILRNAIDRERLRLELRENNLKPRLDLNIGVQSGLGAVAEGGVSRDSTDTVVGLQFSVPLQQRAVRGQLVQSRAALEARQQEQQLTTDQIELEVRNILQELEAARELLELAEQEVTQSSIMRQSEVTRFQSGASDFFLVNIREEVEANARVRMAQAKLATLIARANFDAATVDLQRLGIRESMVPPAGN